MSDKPFVALIAPLSGVHVMPPIYHPGHPDHGLPAEPEPGVPTHPIYHPGHPDHGLPSQPPEAAHPIAPGGPGQPAHPIAPGGQPPQVAHPIAPGGPGAPTQLPAPPTVGQPIEPGGPVLDEGDILIVVFVPGHGLKWVIVDTELMPTHPIVLPKPGDPPTATHPIQPTPAPRK